jgi:hypothetical protein
LRATRPSTLRVYQFRHSRLRAVDDSAGEIVRIRTLLESIRGGRYSPNMCSPVASTAASGAAD